MDLGTLRAKPGSVYLFQVGLGSFNGGKQSGDLGQEPLPECL